MPLTFWIGIIFGFQRWRKTVKFTEINKLNQQIKTWIYLTDKYINRVDDTPQIFTQYLSSNLIRIMLKITFSWTDSSLGSRPQKTRQYRYLSLI